jgi:hypothetical protein
MGIEKAFCPERLVVGVLRSPDFGLKPVEAELEGVFGPIDYRGPEFPFAYSDYYAPEMGEGILRTFLSFSRLIDPSRLAEAKLATDAIEARYARCGSRRANLDPGLLSLGGFILATTKDRAHRIPLNSGIYGELTLYFQGGRFVPLPWTYPDWQSPPYLAVLSELRSRLKLELAGLAK